MSPAPPRCTRHPDKRRYSSALDAACALDDIEQRRVAVGRPEAEAPLAPALCLTCRGWHLVRGRRAPTATRSEDT